MAFFNVMRANDIDDVIYDVTIGNVQHAAHMLQKKITISALLAWASSNKMVRADAVTVTSKSEYHIGHSWTPGNQVLERSLHVLLR